MREVNLLPTELIPSKSTVKLSGNLKKIAVIGFVLVIASLLGLLAYTTILSRNLNQSLSKQEDLKRSIKALENTEKKVVLIQDRVKNAKYVLSQKNALVGINLFKEFFKNFVQDVAIANLTVSTDEIDMDIKVFKPEVFTKILGELVSFDAFKQVTLTNFSFKPDEGYILRLKINY